MISYQAAGVNLEEAYRAVARYRELAGDTPRAAALNSIGSFAGIFSLKEILAQGLEDPVLISGTDGVGTKLDIACKMGKYDTVGIDCVAMCVNDILCHGGKPLFFLDYLACGKLDADIAGIIVQGVAAGCRETGMTLLGGETAEMPGFYPDGVYDIAGFAVGIADRKRLVDGSKIQAGDALIGIASSGVHANGFSLIRKTIPNIIEDFCGKPIGLTLLEPTRLYVKPVLELMDEVEIRGMAHITGGGWYENIPRMFASRMTAVIREESWEIPRIFTRIAQGIAEGSEQDEGVKKMMFNTFNMGIGFVLAVSAEDCSPVLAFLADRGYKAWRLGQVEAGAGGLRFV
ncbi:MAG: phosphoribosylformylglycinamidine cyclo-ligase [Spirochaetaceae bacterium]|jgi:phosphoribosylformylglycinamidine cyclo-ligase|nr:phosphoribosylformylglycinamidine cyclo-ligase [Spirochaetaceae bacterium]